MKTELWNKHKSTIAKLVIFLSILIAGCAILFQLYTKRCLWWDCAPERSFELSELNIPAEYFPDNTDIGQLHQSSEYFGAIKLETAEYFWNSGDERANIWVFQYATVRGASREYAYFLKTFFIENSPEPLKPYPSITFESEIAEEHSIACGDTEFWGRTNYRCTSIARYQEFFLSFSSNIDNDMSYQDFEKIAIFLDQRMKELLLVDQD